MGFEIESFVQFDRQGEGNLHHHVLDPVSNAEMLAMNSLPILRLGFHA